MHLHLHRPPPILALALLLASCAIHAADPAADLRAKTRAPNRQSGEALLKDINLPSLHLAISDLNETHGTRYPRGRDFLQQVEKLEASARAIADSDAKSTSPEQLATLVEQAKALGRQALLSNPLLNFETLILLKRKVNNLGLPHNWESNSSLPRSGFENEIASISLAALDAELKTIYRPDGGKFVGDLDLHFDAGKLLFSSLGAHNRWQVFEIGVGGQGLRQVTPGDQPDVDSYDACYLPNDEIVFNSTACFAGVPCVYGSSHVTNLYRMNARGGNIRQLTVDQEHDWCPTLLNDGRIMYQRWEYTDTPHSQTRLLFAMNPDGTNQTSIYGSNSYWPNSKFYARPLPNHPSRLITVISGHHGVPRMGELVIFDPAQSQYEADGAVQRIPGHGQAVRPIIKDQLVNESWPKFLHPFPLSEKYFLVSAKLTPASNWGIYLVDIFDNVLLLKDLPGYALFEPIPLQKTKRPPVIDDKVDPQRKDSIVYIADIYAGEGLKGVPRGTVKQLRLFSYHFAYQGMGGLLGVIGMDGPWDIRRIMGTVPVEPDGSAKFRIPANTPISLQPLDDEGKALQLMRSWTTGKPGENVSCVGCHEKAGGAPPNHASSAFAREPSEVKPWYGATRGFSYPREVQPVVNRFCVGCHDGRPTAAGATPSDLRGTEKIKDFRMATDGNGGTHAGKFSVGYANLHRFVRRSGIESDYHVLMPKEFHADSTDLIQMLRKGHYNVKLDPEAWDRLITWIDLNAPYHGTWHEELADPGTQRTRRNELRKLYSGVDEDPEAVVETAKYDETFILPPPVQPATVPPKLQNWPFDAATAAKRQADAAAQTRQSIDLGNGIKLDLVLIPAGEFILGDASGDLDERPLSALQIKQSFWMGRVEVSNAQFAAFDPAHDSRIESKQGYQFGIHGYPTNQPDQPVVRVSWSEAMAYCRWLTARTGQNFTLPTEAQWEYACRAGTDTPLFYGDVNSDFSKFANVADAKLREFASNPYTLCEPLKNPSPYDDYVPKDARFNDGALVTVRVGAFQPNAWGLCDMHGNAAEWTRSTYKPYPYDTADGRDDGHDDGRKVVRGGSWRNRPKDCRSACRLSYPAWQGVYNVGFRVICQAPADAKITAKPAESAGISHDTQEK